MAEPESQGCLSFRFGPMMRVAAIAFFAIGLIAPLLTAA